MEKFKNNETVVFIGSSITFNSRWISEIFEYYATNQKGKNIKIYACGVPGGRAESGLFDLERNILKFNPDRAVIMYGINEINAPVYNDDAEETVDNLESRRWHLVRFYNDLTSLANRLSGRNIKIDFCTPTPKDTSEALTSCNCKKINDGLKAAAEITKRVAEEHGAEFVDFFTPMRALVDGVRKIDKNVSFIRDDRTHPNDLGNSIMAKLFLRAQGFDDVLEPTAENVADGSIYTPESDRMIKRREAEEKVQSFYAAEWLVLKNYRYDSLEKRIEQAEKYFESADGGFLKNLAGEYKNLALNLEENRKKLKEITENIYRKGE